MRPSVDRVFIFVLEQISESKEFRGLDAKKLEDLGRRAAEKTAAIMRGADEYFDRAEKTSGS
jgi:hypothetical protein